MITLPHGQLRYSVEEGEITIDNIDVEEAHRRKGIGFALIDELVKVAKELGKNIGICVYPTDGTLNLSSLIEFYESYGFTVNHDDGDCAIMTYAI